MAGGTMQLKAGSSPSDTGYQDELDLELQKFSLENGRTRERLLPSHPLTVKMHGSRRSGQGPFSGQLQVSGWPGTFEARWQDIANQGREQRGSYTVSTSTSSYTPSKNSDGCQLPHTPLCSPEHGKKQYTARFGCATQ